MNPHTLDLHAREKAGKGEEWSVYLYRRLPMDRQVADVFELTGANHRALSRGPRKGRTTWTGTDPKSRCTVYITPAEHEAWLAKREAAGP
jgi:hypothetical protein